MKHALSGTLPTRITLGDLLEAAGELDWGRQLAMLGLDA